MLIHFEPVRFLLVFINLIVLYLFMRKFLFRRITDYMENRSKMIKDSINSAEKSKAEAQELKQQFEQQIRTAKDEADRILNDARSRANKEYEEIVNNAKKDAEGILARARQEAEREKAQMLKDVKNQVTGLAIIVASKVIEANMDTEKNRALADKFIDEVGAA